MTRGALAVVVALAGLEPTAAARVETTCTSPSGKSIYAIRLDTQSMSGHIRYRFMAQDVDYRVELASFKKGLAKGTAHFVGARSGETQGRSFDFTYDVVAGKLTDGSIVAQCR